MPTGVFNERRVRNSDGLKPKLSALRTVQRLLKKQGSPTSSLQDGWGASLLPKGEGEGEGQSEHAQLRNPSPLSSPLLKGNNILGAYHKRLSNSLFTFPLFYTAAVHQSGFRNSSHK